MNKHAYMIIAHNQFDILRLLIQKLDYPYHDIYILIDSKSKFDYNEFNDITVFSKIYWVNRMSISWGDYSLAQAEIELLSEAVKKRYSFYHMLSGVDLPLYKAEEIYHFFEKNIDKEFVEIVNEPIKNFEDRYKYYYFLQKYSKNKLFSLLNKAIVKAQKLIHFSRENKKCTYAKGSNWFSISNHLAIYLVENELQIRKMFKYGFCVDEMFVQTLLINADKKFNHVNDNCRFTIWDDEHVSSPKVLTSFDYDKIVRSGAMFARKFDTKQSAELIKLLFKEG